MASLVGLGVGELSFKLGQGVDTACAHEEVWRNQKNGRAGWAGWAPRPKFPSSSLFPIMDFAFRSVASLLSETRDFEGLFFFPSHLFCLVANTGLAGDAFLVRPLVLLARGLAHIRQA